MRTLMTTISMLAMASTISACSTWHHMWNDDDSDRSANMSSSSSMRSTQSDTSMTNSGSSIDAMHNPNAMTDGNMQENYVGDMYRSPRNRHHDR